MGANEKHDATHHGGEYTPDTEEVEVSYTMDQVQTSLRKSTVVAREEFRRWLGSVRAEAKAEALEEAVDALEAGAKAMYDTMSLPSDWSWEKLRGDQAFYRDLAQSAVSAYLEVAQHGLERRIRTEVCRIVTNASNWPTPVGAQMLGLDLAEPIDMISDAVVKIIQETFTESKQDRVIN